MMHQWPDEGPKTWQEATYYYELGRYAQAKKRFMRVLANEPTDGTAMYFIASCAFHLEQTEEAEKYAREALRRVSNKEPTFALLGAICMEKKAYVEAEESLLQALAINGCNAGILAQYAYLMLKTGYEKKARQLLEEAHRLAPTDEAVLHYRYFFQRAYGEQSKQEQTLSQYMLIAGNDVDKLMKLGLSALDRQAYRGAREYFWQAYLLDPMNGQLVKVLKELDVLLHPVFWAKRLLLKTGGPAIWCGLLIALFIFAKLEWLAAAAVTGMISALFCIYVWLSPIFYRWTRNIDRRG